MQYKVNDERFNHCPIRPLRAGRVCDYGDSFYEYMVFNRKVVEAWADETIENIRKEDGSITLLAQDLTGWYAYESGAGRWFAADPYIKVIGNKVLVKHFRALDV